MSRNGSIPGTPQTPGSEALLNYKKQNSSSDVFKKPSGILSLGVKVRKSKPKQKILTEDKYVEEIAKIIQRDFFPDLEKLKAQNDYLDAMDRNDFVKMESIRAKYSSGQTPAQRARSMTPATFETPISIAGQQTPITSSGDKSSPGSESVKSACSTASTDGGSKRSIGDKLSLDSFLQSYTSEDNFSFQEIIDTADRKLREKFAILYNEEQLSNDKLAKALALPSIEQQFDEPDPLRKIETWSYKNMNSIMYIPDGVRLTERERIEMANRKQVIQHSSTRLGCDPFQDKDGSNKNQTLQTQGSNNCGGGGGGVSALMGKVGLDGNPLVPQVKGFDLIKTPSPRPGEAFSPLMTWGEIEGTPFRLDGSDTPVVHSNAGPSFKINESSRRESIALALAEKVGEKMRAQKQKAMNTARKNISSPFGRTNIELLSPAAQLLATTKLGLRTPNSMMSTPSPMRTPAKKTRIASSKGNISQTITKKSIQSKVNTPLAQKTSDLNADAAATATSSLTDDLLKIPTKRLKASDFF